MTSSITTYLPYTLLHPFSLLPSFLRPSKIGPKPSLILGLICGFSLSITLASLTRWAKDRWKLRWVKNGTRTHLGSRRRLTLDRDRESGGRNFVEVQSEEIVQGGIEGLIGNTPLIRINSLSDALGEVEILGKCEFMNPFGSVKDRVSLKIIQQAEEEGLIHPHTGSTIFEGTSGSTGISIAGIAKARGYHAHIIVPDDVAQEKIDMLKVLGAEIEKVRPVSIVDKKHYVNLARLRALQFGQTESQPTSSLPSPSAPKGNSRRTHTIRSTISASTPSRSPQSTTPTSFLSRTNSATSPDFLVTEQERDIPNQGRSPSTSPYSSSLDTLNRRDQPRGLFADQFENLSNYTAHSLGTAPEIYDQTSGILDGFVSGAGTGGTIAGVGRTLKKLTNNEIEVVLSDPEGSGLYYWIREGVMWNEKEEEGKRRRFQVDTIVEGIGLNRSTKNLKLALPIIDDAYRVTDAEALSMSRHLALQDGLFLGSSSAVNLVTCVRLAQRWIKERKADKMGLHGLRKLRIVTILCDSGTRHTSKFWNEEYLKRNHIEYSDNLDWLFVPATTSHSSNSTEHQTVPDSSSAREVRRVEEREQEEGPSEEDEEGETFEEEEEERDHGETNLSKTQDEDFASSNPRDLPPLDL